MYVLLELGRGLEEGSAWLCTEEQKNKKGRRKKREEEGERTLTGHDKTGQEWVMKMRRGVSFRVSKIKRENGSRER